MSMVDLAVTPTSGRSTRGRTPIYRMMVNGVDVDWTVLTASFVFAEGAHDTAVLNVSSATATTTDGLVNQPISFLFGMAPRSEEFVGYITDELEAQSTAGSLTFTANIKGPTKEMQNGKQHFWSGRTVPAAVSSLAARNGMGFHGHEHAYQWPSLAQTDDTDWKTVNDFANRLGWCIYNRYGVVMCYDPVRLLTENGAITPIRSEQYSTALSDVDPEHSLLEFTPTEKTPDSVDVLGTVIGYFDNGNTQVSRQSGATRFLFDSDRVVRSAVEAKLYLDAQNVMPQNWLQSAQARILGNASIYPAMNVEVYTVNAMYFPGKFNGRWLVRGVVHKMDQSTFQTSLVLGRPSGKTQVALNAPYSSFWQGAGRARPSLTAVDQVWVSSWANPSARDFS